MLEMRNEIAEMAANKGVEIKGIEEVPIIMQGRPMFDFVGANQELLDAHKLSDDDLYLHEGIMNIAVFPDGRVEGLKTVSKQYNMLQHLEAIKNVFATLPEEFDLKNINIMVSPDGGKCFAKFDSGHTIEIKPGDDITYQLLMENSADTTTRFSLSGSAWRLICSNGQRIPDSRIEQIAKKKLHKGGLELEKEISEFLEIMNTSIESMGVWKAYTGKKVGIPQLEEVFEMLEVGPRVSEELLDLELRGEDTSPRHLLDNNKLTAWDLYNAFTQRITDSDSLEAVKVERGNKVAQTFDRMFVQ